MYTILGQTVINCMIFYIGEMEGEQNLKNYVIITKCSNYLKLLD